eukprot:jgi/Hompol1/3769/HPOL_003348-RA
MIIWETIRFACQKCQAGHRTSSCAHANRRIEEVKAKGRPVSQCGHCRSKRKKGVGHSHHRCLCGERPPKATVQRAEVSFATGLVLCLEPRDGNHAHTLRTMVGQRLPFRILVVKKLPKNGISAASLAGNASGSATTYSSQDPIAGSDVNTPFTSTATPYSNDRPSPSASLTSAASSNQQADTDPVVMDLVPVDVQFFETPLDDGIKAIMPTARKGPNSI